MEQNREKSKLGSRRTPWQRSPSSGNQPVDMTAPVRRRMQTRRCWVQSEVTAMAFNPLHTEAGGSQIQVESETNQVLSIAAVVYLVPLILFFLLYAAGRMRCTHTSESVSIALGGLGFFVGIAAAVYANSVVKRRRLQLPSGSPRFWTRDSPQCLDMSDP